MKWFPLYPYFFIIYLALDLLSHNLDQINISQSFRSIPILLLLTWLAILIFRFIFKDWRFASYLIFLILFFFFVNSHVLRVIQDVVPDPIASWSPLLYMVIWGFVIFVFGLFFWRLIPNKKDLTFFLNIVFLIVLLPTGYRFYQSWSGGFGSMFSAAKEVKVMSDPSVHGDLLESEGIILAAETPPDIYVIILDGYGRSDVLNELYGYDNREFVAGLEDRGFYVAESSRTNYIQTMLSLSALLNFDYFKDWIPQDNEASYLQYVRTPVAHNRLFSLLNTLGYTIVAIDNTYEVQFMQGIDLHLNPFIKLNHFERLILSGTPLAVLNDFVHLGFLPTQSFEVHRRLVSYSFEELGDITSIPSPKLVFVHIISPHPPFVFDDEGNPVQPDHAFDWADGSHYKGDHEDYIIDYLQQAKFVTGKIIYTIDSILENSAEPPIIVLQSDHGPGSLLDWETHEKTCLWERTSILNAYYFPGLRTDGLYEDITPVNTFRMILSTYFGANLGLLEDRVYYTPWGTGATMTDVTEMTGLKENCIP